MPGKPVTSALANLRDIHLPAPVSFWPLAPGWYMLVALLLLIGFFLTRAFVNYYRHRRPKRQALRLLVIYQQQYQQVGNAALVAAQISELLKRVALHYFPRREVASLQGEGWINFLSETSKGLDFNSVRHELVALPFMAKSECDLSTLFTLAHDWIKQRRKPCLN